MHHGLVILNIEIRRIDISTSSAEIAIERQRLVEFTRHMQPHILRDAAIVGIEVTVVPLVATLILARLIGPTIVATHGQHVLTFFDIRSQVEATGHHHVLAVAQVLTVEIEVCPLPDALKLDEVFPAGHLLVFEFKMFPIPADSVCQVNNISAESLVAVEGIGQCDLQLSAVIESGCGSIRKVTYVQPPLTIEITLLALHRLRCGQEEEGKHQ